MGCRLLPVFLFVGLLTGNQRKFVDTAPLDIKTAQEVIEWKIYNQNRKFDYFDETKEKQWNGPFYFVQGADIQFGFIARELDNKKVITWEKENALAESIVERINKMNPKPRFFVMCGDLCDAFPDSESELRAKQEMDYKRIFGKVDKDIPVICVCGNHDVGNTPTQETVQMYKSSFGDDFFSFWCGGVLFLVINSQYFFDPSLVQDIAEEHSGWIEEKLREAQEEKKRVVVFQHIPWFLKSIDEEESYFALKSDLRRKWLEKFKNAGVEAIFCGHYHRNAGGVYNGMDVVVTSAVGGQLGTDKPGARIVNVLENKISHTYYETKDLPLNNKVFDDETVKELESLKSAVESNRNPGEEISVSRSQTSFFSDVNGHKSGFKEIKNEVNKNGEVLAKMLQKVDMVKNKEDEPKSASRTEVEIPSKGIHDVIVKDDFNLETPVIYQNGHKTDAAETKRTGNGIDKMNSLSGIKYTPLDMAEYIFWTGDEKGVALTIEEFLEEGLMSRQEAINFLQSIKFNLDFMQAHYQGLQKIDEKLSSKGRTDTKRNLLNQEKYPEKPKVNLFDEQHDNSKLLPYDLTLKSSGFEDLPSLQKMKQNSYPEQINDGHTDSSEQEYPDSTNKNNRGMKTLNKIFEGLSVNDDDYEEVLERLRVADFLYKEYSLEEVIFQLAKVMFSQSLTRGNKEAQKALQRFSAFLQNEVKHGQISKNLERKILDVLITALMDTLSEHPELMTSAKKELQSIVNMNSPTSLMLKQLLMPGIEQSTAGKSNIKEGKSLSEEEKSAEGLLKKVE